MEPKTKLQKHIAELAAQLPAITNEMAQWAYSKCFDSYAVMSRKTLFCLDCGSSWKDISTVCPGCNAKLKMAEWKSDRKQEYFALLTVIGGFQVVRLVCVYKDMKKGRAANLYFHEVMQHYIDASGTMSTMSKTTQSFTRCYDLWVFGSSLEFRAPTQFSDNRNNLNPYVIYPDKKVLPVIKRNGFKTSVHDIAPQNLFKYLLTDSICETLLKAKQYSLLQYYFDRPEKIRSYWNAIKICIRNKYRVKDAGIWIDYLHSLEHFSKDLRNAKFICPPDLHAAHNVLMKKKRAIYERENAAEVMLNEQRKAKTREELISRIDQAQMSYEMQKAAFFGIQFTDGKITVDVLKSVEEFLKEGDAHDHCVFTKEYFKEPDSLVLSAKIGKKLVETVEVSLSKLKVIQARGADNKPTKYHNDIISLVNKNMHQIRAAI